jgi:tetratricopeptide (TPR) repeat protein
MNEKALEHYTKNLASSPMNARDLVTVLRLEKKLGRRADAVKTAKKLAARHPKNVEGHLEMARWFLKQGEDAKAESEFRMVAALDPGSPEKINNSAFAAAARKKYGAALKSFNAVLAKDPGNLRALYGLVTVYNRKKDYDNVKLYAKKALAVEPDFAPVLNRLAWAMAVSGENLDEAEKISKASLKLNPNSAGYMDTLSEIYYRKGDSGKAVEWVNRAIKLEPKSRWYKSQLKKFRKGPPKTGRKKK